MKSRVNGISISLAAVLMLGTSFAGGTRRAVDSIVVRSFPTSWDEYQALLKNAEGGTRKTYETIPDWTGVWQRDPQYGLYSAFDDEAGPNPAMGAAPVYGRNSASLTPAYQAAYEKKAPDIIAVMRVTPRSFLMKEG